MRAAIYARKSTEQNGVADEARSVHRQIEAAKTFITSKGWTLTETFTDDGISGALFSTRAAFQTMMRAATLREFDAVVLFDLDRLGRDGHQVMVALYALAEYGVTVWDSSSGRQIELDSFEQRLPTILRAEFAQQEREQARKRTRAAMYSKFLAGHVVGGSLYGYDSVRVAKGEVRRTVNEAEAAIVRQVYEQFAEGVGLRTIATSLNKAGVRAPRAKNWSATSVRELLRRPVYRGIAVYGKTKRAYGRELGPRRGAREEGQISQSESDWRIREDASLRVVSPELAARVDARCEEWQQRTAAGKKTGKAEHKGHGRYLLTGGMLRCPTCNGHFEALAERPGKQRGKYICSTRRRKPGTCTNRLSLPIKATDDAVLDLIEDEALSPEYIKMLMSLVATGETDDTPRLTAERDQLQREMDALLDLVASGVSKDTVLAKVRERELALKRVEKELAKPRQGAPDAEALKAALEQRASEWRTTLRDRPEVARLVLKKLIEPLELSDPDDFGAFTEWEASLRPGLLEGLAPVQLEQSGTCSTQKYGRIKGLLPRAA